MEQETQPKNLINTKIPSFEMDVFQDGKINKKNNSDFVGKWLVLFFYPADFTFVCPTELEELADKYEEFKSLDVEIVSVSNDTAFAHKAWHDISPAMGKVKYPMAADTNGRLSKALGVYIEEEGVSLRGTFIVSPEGFIKGIEINDNSIGRSVTELLRKVRAAQFVESHGGKVCPASWREGDDTLTPNEDLIGKI